MKKLLLSLAVLLLGATQMIAQTTIAHDTVHYFGFPKDAGSHALKDSIVNSSASPAVVTWSKSAETLLTGWTGVGICDPVNCFMFNGASHSATLAPGQTGVWYVDMSAIPTAADGSSYVTLTTNFGDMTFKFTSWATQVKDFENNNLVTIYPNPATSYINIAINDNRVSSINVMNVVGKKVGRFAVDANTPNPIRIPLDNVLDGVYLLQFTDANGKLLGVRRVTKN
jgi:hypothetical protein